MPHLLDLPPEILSSITAYEPALCSLVSRRLRDISLPQHFARFRFGAFTLANLERITSLLSSLENQSHSRALTTLTASVDHVEVEGLLEAVYIGPPASTSPAYAHALHDCLALWEYMLQHPQLWSSYIEELGPVDIDPHEMDADFEILGNPDRLLAALEDQEFQSFVHDFLLALEMKIMHVVDRILGYMKRMRVVIFTNSCSLHQLMNGIFKQSKPRTLILNSCEFIQEKEDLLEKASLEGLKSIRNIFVGVTGTFRFILDRFIGILLAQTTEGAIIVFDLKDMLPETVHFPAVYQLPNVVILKLGLSNANGWALATFPKMLIAPKLQAYRGPVQLFDLLSRDTRDQLYDLGLAEPLSTDSLCSRLHNCNRLMNVNLNFKCDERSDGMSELARVINCLPETVRFLACHCLGSEHLPNWSVGVDHKWVDSVKSLPNLLSLNFMTFYLPAQSPLMADAAKFAELYLSHLSELRQIKSVFPALKVYCHNIEIYGTLEGGLRLSYNPANLQIAMLQGEFS